MKIRRILAFAIVASTLASCVTARQYEELQAKKEFVEKENTALKAKNTELTTANTELTSGLDKCTERRKALESDTTILGTSLRHMTSQYDKINELNDLLTSKNSKLLNEAAAENRNLLQELDITRLELQKKENELHALEADLNAKEEDLNKLSEEVESREQRVNELEALIAAKDEIVNNLKNKVTDALLGFKDKGLSIEQKNGKVYVSLDAKLLFPSGSTKINAEGKEALIGLAEAIQDQSDLEIIVEGHTDTDKIRSSTVPKDNWELSVLRATSVVKIMQENSSINPKILSAAGRSEYHPVDEGDKAKNRRIEIILSPNLNELFEIIEG
ncbi:MAG: OmpA family protein [Flavobacteriales bacterium]|nr:OmpA family protein [Flavobacteriales bacterium]